MWKVFTITILINSNTLKKMKHEIIEKLEERIADDCKPVDQEKHYNDMLDEIYSFERVGGPFAYMSASRVLKEVDPTAYRCGMNDWADGEGWIEVGNESYEQDDVEKARDEFLEEMDSEISDLETEIETKEAEENPNVSELATLKRKLLDLRADYIIAKSHVF